MKNITRPQVYRIRRIVEMIRQELPGGRLPSAGDFARELDVSWHTIIRDLNFLRDDEGAPIHYDASRKGYLLTDRGWSLRPVTLNQGEVFAFSVASRMIQPFRGTPLEMDVQSLFDKIARSLEGTVTLSVDALTDQFSVIADDYVPVNADRWERAIQSIERKEVIRIRYRKFSGELNSYVLTPVHLAAYHGNWYLIALVDDQEKPQTFALSRIKSFASTGRTDTVSDGVDIAGYLKSAFGIAHGEKEISVRLLFSKQVATYIAERQWHSSQKIKILKNGSVELQMKTRGWKELVRWILSWQPDVKVLAPVELRDRVIEKMRMGLSRK